MQPPALIDRAMPEFLSMTLTDGEIYIRAVDDFAQLLDDPIFRWDHSLPPHSVPYLRTSRWFSVR
jgi:hypothetical protein